MIWDSQLKQRTHVRFSNPGRHMGGGGVATPCRFATERAWGKKNILFGNEYDGA